jgi:glycogen debranching enzyme
MVGKSAHSFYEKAASFLDSTEEYVHHGINPGGYYKGIWSRDAAYILKDWFLVGLVENVFQELLFIWSHQIAPDREKILYGRGSPDMGYVSQVADDAAEKRFEGALPTTIFRGFSEVFSQNPDIDSTALMISSTSWILDAYLKAGMIEPSPDHLRPTSVELLVSSGVAKPHVVIDFAIPRMLKAVDYLQRRDRDGDGLLEQGHNEDWMDTVLRTGKVVYNQATWILALSNLASVLSTLGMHDQAARMIDLAKKAVQAVEQKLWVEEQGTYVDIPDERVIPGGALALTQDVSLYLIAISENTIRDALGSQLKGEENASQPSMRAHSTLDAIKNRMWTRNGWPLVTESQLEKTGPWRLDPNQYHNHTLWPWTTGIEMLARSRFDRIDECESILSTLTRGRPDMLAFYEWTNPVTAEGDGAYPFRTGISSVRIAIHDILARREQQVDNQKPI